MELAVYMDDSSDGLHEEIVVASGAFGLPEKWFDVERLWDRELHKHGLSNFHATACESLRDEFHKFHDKDDPAAGRAKADQIRLDLIDIANSGGIVYAAVGIKRADWKSVISEQRFRSLGMPSDPMFFAYHLLMIQCIDRITKHHAVSTVAFVCDNHNRYETAEAAYHNLKELNSESAKHMGSISHRSSRGNAPIQVADLVAHEARLFMLGKIGRPSYYKLEKHMFYAAMSDRRHIEVMLSSQERH